jgi:hypothetical protein
MNAKRASLSGMLDAPAELPPMPGRQRPESQTPEIQTPGQRTPEVRTPEVRRLRSDRAPAQDPGTPKYRQLERKELLIWPDQITELSILARTLNRNRGGAGERLTPNTLIRVAVALLLSRAPDLAGTTEQELRRSLGLSD